MYIEETILWICKKDPLQFICYCMCSNNLSELKLFIYPSWFYTSYLIWFSQTLFTSIYYLSFEPYPGLDFNWNIMFTCCMTTSRMISEKLHPDFLSPQSRVLYQHVKKHGSYVYMPQDGFYQSVDVVINAQQSGMPVRMWVNSMTCSEPSIANGCLGSVAQRGDTTGCYHWSHPVSWEVEKYFC